jgi:anti-sigma factor RsiW
VALVVALGAAVGGILFPERTTRSGEAPSVIAALAEDHARAMSDARIASRDASEIARWLAARLPFAVHVPDLAEAELRGARLCLMDGRRGAVIEYRVGGEPLSYFVLPDARVPAAPTEIRFEHTARIGYGIVWWREPGLMHAMVGRLPTSRLEHFARLCVKQMQTALARLGLERSGSSWRDA